LPRKAGRLFSPHQDYFFVIPNRKNCCGIGISVHRDLPTKEAGIPERPFPRYSNRTAALPNIGGSRGLPWKCRRILPKILIRGLGNSVPTLKNREFLLDMGIILG
jgi:hypothetical protein